MPSLGVPQFEMTLRGLSLRPTEKAILLCLARREVDLGANFAEALEDLATRCHLPRPHTFRVMADLAERGFIRVDGPYVEVAAP